MQRAPGEPSIKKKQLWGTAVLRDLQFWVPFIVLLIGLLLLRVAR